MGHRTMRQAPQTARPPGTAGQEQPGRDVLGQDARKQRRQPTPTCRRRPWCTSATWHPACTSNVFERHSASPAGRGRANVWARCVDIPLRQGFSHPGRKPLAAAQLPSL